VRALRRLALGQSIAGEAAHQDYLQQPRIEEFMNAVTKTEGAALSVTMGFNDLASTMGD
jgi:hypothetical protein